MTNEQYLIVSYVAVAGACLALGLATHALLHRSFAALTAAAPGGRLGRIFKRLFLLGIVLPAMAGFLSVSFRSCEVRTYAGIVANRSYLIAKNLEQLGASLSYIAIAIWLWGFLIAAGFLFIRRMERRGG
ncbi:MAG: hypothetical protein AB1640_24290 [bacterium]